MKNIGLQLLLVIVLFVLYCPDLLAQEKAQAPKVKSLVVQEEDLGKPGTGKRLESETIYDQAGNVVEEKQYKDGKFDSHEKNEYDKDGNKTKVTNLDENGRMVKYTVYKYERGLRTEKAVYGPNQKLKSRKTYQYKFY